jgi:hypothetical protein
MNSPLQWIVGSLLGLIVGSSTLLGQNWTKELAKKVLKTAEEIRSLEKADIAVDLKNVEGKKTVIYDLKILRSTGDRAYLEFLAPAEERGRKMLAKGRSYWSTFPDSKRIVAISRREMIGNSAFALADIFQLDSEKDYDPEIVAEEVRDGVKVYKLSLKSKHEDTPYASILYWVEIEGLFPNRAQFYGVSGKHIKTMTIDSRTSIAGRIRPEVTRMVDEITEGHISWWKTKKMDHADIPDHVFSKEYLKSNNTL